MFKWEPWKVFRGDQEILPISCPPCSECKYWKPIRMYTDNGVFDGIRCCHANDMQLDFGCFESKDVPLDGLEGT